MRFLKRRIGVSDGGQFVKQKGRGYVSAAKGFTLAEILVVLAIISMVMITIIPNVAQKAVTGDETVIFFEELIKEHLLLAEGEGVPIHIVGFKGSSNLLKHDGHRDTIPGVGTIQSAYINDQETRGIEYHITVYPDGIVDHFVLETSTKHRIESKPLLMTVTKERRK